MQSAFSRESARTAKGILIALVIFGHLPKEFHLVESLNPSIYNFHIPCFFLLVLSRKLPAKLDSFEDACKIAFARIWPVIPFSFFSFIVYNMLIGDLRLWQLSPQLGKYFLALSFGSYRLFDDATGLEIYWFMYAFAGFYLFHLWFQWELKTQWIKIVVISTSLLLGTLAVFYMPEHAPSWLAIPLYAYPLFLGSYNIFKKSLDLGLFGRKYGLALEAALFLVMCSTWASSHSYNLAHLRVPLPWLFGDYLAWMVFITLSFKLLMRMSRMGLSYFIFGALGGESLGVYLVHQYFLYGFWSLVMKFGCYNEYLLVPLFACTLIASYLSVVYFKKFKHVILRFN